MITPRRPVIFTIFALFVSTATFAAKSKPAPEKVDGIALIQKVVHRYNQKAALKMGVEKTAYLALLEETKKSTGIFYYSKGRLRLEIRAPEPMLIVMNDSAIWVETKVEGWSAESTHVTKITSKDLKNQSRAPLAALLGKEKVWDEFKVLSQQKDGDTLTIALEPKNKKAMPDVASVTMKVNEKKNEIRSLSYKDDLDNEMTYELSSPKATDKIPEKLFQYKPPKDAEVVVY